MPELTIDGRYIEVPDGATVLEAARALGIHIPTLCYREGCEPSSSCMLCVVKDTHARKLIPSCAAPAVDGMVLETGTEEVRDARRTALELLLGEHIGDCEGPCRRICPAHMDIPLMIRQIAAGDMRGAIATVKRDIALPAVLGRICPAPCEKGCRRSFYDSPVSIYLLKRHAADVDLAGEAPYLPECRPSVGKRVAIIGAGPAGLAAAWHLLQEGVACTIFDDREQPGGMLRCGVDRKRLPRTVLDAEIGVIAALGARFQMKTRIGADMSMRDLRGSFDAVVIAAGEAVKEAAETFGVETGRRGVRADRRSRHTNIPGVFAGGGAVAPTRMAVRAVADGKAVAVSVRQHLAGMEVTGPREPFNTQIGRLGEGEIQEFMKGVDTSGRVAPAGGAAIGFAGSEAVTEARRCLHCDCRKAGSCLLRDRAGEHRADRHRYRGAERGLFEKVMQDSRVIYEPGKCIKCGACVCISREAGEPLGLAFIGRGFDLRIGVPFNETLAKGLQRAAAECVRACPTGALAFANGEEAGGE